MPPVAPCMPRKMLPPPTTIAISTPRSARALVTSPAMRCTTSESIPKPTERSANASPESLSTTRRYLLSGISISLAFAGAWPGSFVVSRLRGRSKWSVLTDLDAGETADGGIGAQGLHERADRLLLVLDERLLDQRDRLEEAVELPLDDLGPCLLGFALFRRLLLQ